MEWKKCTRCKIEKSIDQFYNSNKTYCKDCVRINSRVSARKYYLRKKYGIDTKSYKELRIELIERYGGECICCGETTYEFLAFDHKDNDGKEWRKIHGSGIAMFNYLRKNQFPDIVQLLCHNCNMAKQFYGQCPHKGCEGE